ncbi:MAG: DUF2809 domain-containing protein [Acidimicrobiales bacterium]
MIRPVRPIGARGPVLAALGIVVAAGLATRRVDAMPGLIEDHAGDVLWATAVVLALGVLVPSRRPLESAIGGYAIATAVEASQLWNPAWLDDLRSNDLAALVLGRGFLWVDLLRYAAGCVLGMALLTLVHRSTAVPPPA